MQAPLVLLLALPVVTPSAPGDGSEAVVGRLAPDVDLGAWLEPAPDDGAVRDRSFDVSGRPGERAGRLAAGDRGRIAAHHGVPLVLHTLAWDDATSTDDLLPLMRALVEANVDRGIAVIGVANGAGDTASEAELAALERHAPPYPIARADLMRAAPPYLDVAANGLVHAVVIGPNGALLWRGDPLDDERDFLAAVQAGYARPVVEPLERALHDELAKAEAAYLAGELKDARGKAERLARDKDAAVAADAAALVERVLATQEAWLAEARQHGTSGPDLRYFEVAAWLRAALPRTDAEKDLDALEKEVKKQKFWRLRAQDLEGWLELRAERPALFPAREDKAGDAFAKDLEKLLRSTFNSNEATQAAKDLLERYAATQAREG